MDNLPETLAAHPELEAIAYFAHGESRELEEVRKNLTETEKEIWRLVVMRDFLPIDEIKLAKLQQKQMEYIAKIKELYKNINATIEAADGDGLLSIVEGELRCMYISDNNQRGCTSHDYTKYKKKLTPEEADTAVNRRLGVGHLNLKYAYIYTCFSLNDFDLANKLLRPGGIYWGEKGLLHGGWLTKWQKPV